MSPIGLSQGGIVAPLWGLALCPLGLWLGQGLVLVMQTLVFCSGKMFPGLEQFPGDLQGFKTLTLGPSSS